VVLVVGASLGLPGFCWNLFVALDLVVRTVISLQSALVKLKSVLLWINLLFQSRLKSVHVGLS
jgi:hypothetical protein